MKKILMLVIVSTLICSTGIFAKGEPSKWAEIEVQKALGEGFVIDELIGEYQRPITRAEYVLIANKILKQKLEKTEIKQRYPFKDVYEQYYEYEIARAYNAGIIDGYEDGTFRADKEITREEMAKLMVNIIRYLDPKRYYWGDENNFSDFEKIGEWSLSDCNYCYENDIIKGVLKNDGSVYMNPKGNASVEEAILIIYRLAAKEELTKSDEFGTIKITNIDEFGKETYVESNIIIKFANNFGENFSKLVKQYVNANTLILLKMNEYEAKLVDVKGQSIEIKRYLNEAIITIKITDSDPKENTVYNIYEMMQNSFDSKEVLLENEEIIDKQGKVAGYKYSSKCMIK